MFKEKYKKPTGERRKEKTMWYRQWEKKLGTG
jgi:hypothetical protein